MSGEFRDFDAEWHGVDTDDIRPFNLGVREVGCTGDHAAMADPEPVPVEARFRCPTCKARP